MIAPGQIVRAVATFVAEVGAVLFAECQEDLGELDHLERRGDR